MNIQLTSPSIASEYERKNDLPDWAADELENQCRQDAERENAADRAEYEGLD